MRDKIIINDTVPFELLLEHVKISYQETSPRYKDAFSTKYSFPFEFFLDRDLKMKIGDFSSVNKTDLKTLYKNCWHVVDGRVNKALLKIISVVGNVARAQISTGFDVFPNWNKKLHNLPLEVVKTDTKDMTEIASKISKDSYPITNYNFPLIYTGLYKDKDLFKDFKGALNNIDDSGVFLENTKHIADNEYQNENIIIPVPYWLHVLKTGFEDAGYSLHGDVLEDPLLLKTLIAPAKKIKIFNHPKPIEWSVGMESAEFNFVVLKMKFPKYYEIWKAPKLIHYPHFSYKSSTELNFRGRFRIKLEMNFDYSKPNHAPDEDHKPILKLNGNTIYKINNKSTFKIDEIIIETVKDENILEFSCVDTEREPLKMTIIPMEFYDKKGVIKKSLANFQEVDLAENLPNKTFGHFVKTTKNLLNLDFTIKNGTEVWMNYAQNSFKNTDYIDLSYSEVKTPERFFGEDLVFELTYPKVEKVNEEKYHLFIDKNGGSFKQTVSTKNFKSIQIPVLPLNMKYYSSKRSVFQTTESDNYYQILLYNGLNKGKNLAMESSLVDIKQIYYSYWQRWLKFRIYAVNIKWKFLVNKNKFRSVNVLSTIFAYKQKIFIRKISKQSVDSKTYEISIDGDIVRN